MLQEGVGRTAGFALTLRPGVVGGVLAAIAALLVLGSLLATTTVWLTGHDYAYGLIPSLRVDAERSFPTYFSSAQLAMAAGLLALITAVQRQRGDGDRLKWLILAFGFAFMSMDEIVSLHEKLILPLRAAFDLEGPSVFHFAWVVVAIPLVGFLGVYFLRFLLRLPAPTGRLFVLSAAIYLGGALVVEMIGGYYASLHPERVDMTTPAFFRYELIVTAEEALEMLGISAFIYALLHYLTRQVGTIRIGFGTA